MNPRTPRPVAADARAAMEQTMQPPPGPRIRVTVTCPTHGTVHTDTVPKPDDVTGWLQAEVQVAEALHGCRWLEATWGHENGRRDPVQPRRQEAM